MEIFILFAIVAAGALIRLPLLKFPIDDDLGYFSYAPWFRHRGVRLGRDIYTRLPMHWFYIAAFSLFGRRPGSVKIFDAIYELVTACVLYTLCAIAISPAVGLAAAALYLWFANSESIALFSGCNERYYGLFTAAGFLFLLLGLQAPAGTAAGWFFVCGLFMGGAIYFKDILITNIAAAALTVWFVQPSPGDALLWLGAGFLLVAVVIYLPLIHFNGGIPAFIKLSLEGYKRALQDNPDRGSVGKLFKNGGWFFLETAPLAVVPALYIFTLAPGSDNMLPIVLAVWLASTVAALLIQSVYWPYHFIPLLPVLAVTSAVGMVWFAAQYDSLSGETRQLWWIALGVSFSIAGYLQIRALIAGGNPTRPGASFTWHKHEQLTVVPKIADYIRARTSEGDYIYQWGYLYHLYMLADRLCPVYGCVALAPPTLPWKLNRLREIVDGLRKNPPKYIVLHLQSIDMTVLGELTGLRYEQEIIFSRAIRLYRLTAVREAATPREIDFPALEELLADSDIPFELGMELMKEGDTAGASELFNETLSLNEAHLGALFGTAKIAWKESRHELAEQTYKRLAEWDDPKYRLDAAHELIKLYTQTANRDGVEDLMRSLEKRGELSDPVIAYLLARFFIKQENPDRALEIYQNVKPSSHTPKNRQFYAAKEYHTGSILFDKGDYERAISHLELCLKIEPAHSKAEATLAQAKDAQNPLAVNNVLVFACAAPKEINLSLDAAVKDFPGCKITLVALQKTGDRYADDPRIDDIITLPIDSFSITSLLFPSTRKLLAAAHPDVAVIPTPLPNLSHNAFVYINVVLYASVAGPKRLYFYKSPYFNRRETSLGACARVFTRKIYEAFLMPYWLAADLYELWHDEDKRETLCFTPEPNDLIAHTVKAQWMTQNGINGVSFNSYMGNPYSLYYPWLSIWLLGRLGTVGFMLLQMSAFGIGAAATAIVTGNSWLIFFVPHLLSSLYFRLSTISIGRLDFLAWGFILASLAAFHTGHPLVAALFFSAAILGHTAVSILGGGGLFIIAVTTGKFFPDFLIMVAVTMAITFSWWYPFLKNLGKFAFHRVWNEIGFCKNNYLSYIWPFRNLTLFLIAAFLTVDTAPAQIVLLIPWSIYLFALLKKRYVLHTDNLTGAILVFGTFALFVNPAWELVVLFFILINAVDALDNPRICPIYEEPFLTKAGELFGPVAKDRRLALECRPQEYWDDNMCWGWLFNLAANKSGFQLLAGVGFDQVDPDLPLDCEIKVNNGTSPEKLEAILRKTACGYVASYTPEFAATLEAMGFGQIGKKYFPPFGFLKEREWTLYQASFETQMVDPAAEWDYRKNGLRFKPNGASNYRVKLAYYPGWEAVQNGRKLPVKDLSPGMEVTVNGPEEVLMRFKKRVLSA